MSPTTEEPTYAKLSTDLWKCLATDMCKEFARSVLLPFVTALNMRQGVEYLGWTDPGHSDLLQLLRVS